MKIKTTEDGLAADVLVANICVVTVAEKLIGV
jgi:hypothetical protein